SWAVKKPCDWASCAGRCGPRLEARLRDRGYSSRVRRLVFVALTLLLLLTLSAGSAFAGEAQRCCDEGCHSMKAMCHGVGCIACTAEAIPSATAAVPRTTVDVLAPASRLAIVSAPADRVWRPPRSAALANAMSYF
ncbi:MAG TPA: hypothetical protein VEZ89_07220, partial [Rubrivivax sp.]|nr:hypothetical protein [Rubrivivax sp.]